MASGANAFLLKYRIVVGAQPRYSNSAHASNGLLLAAVCQALHARSYNHGRRLLRTYNTYGLHGAAFLSPRTFDTALGAALTCYTRLCHVTLLPGRKSPMAIGGCRLTNTFFIKEQCRSCWGALASNGNPMSNGGRCKHS